MSEEVSSPVGIAAEADHQDATKRDRNRGLVYPMDERVPQTGELIEVAKDMYWARIPLPWSLDHINIYLADEGDSWTVIDTGANTSTGREAWASLREQSLGGKPISRVVGTHLHPDHIGLAGWLIDADGGRLSMTQGEYLLAHYLWSSAADGVADDEIAFLISAGMKPEYIEMVKQAGFGGFKKGVHKLPRTYDRLQDGSRITIAGAEWVVIIGRGHSPEHACLYCAEKNLMIGGDQILPTISSNVSVYASEPMANPLADWILSLHRLSLLDADPLVLPSHGRIFKGYEKRLKALIGGHDKQLQRLLRSLEEKPRSAVSAFKPLFGRVITGFDFFMALGESVAHLHTLESLGLAKREKADGVTLFSPTGKTYPDNVVGALQTLPSRELRSISDHGLPEKAA